MALHGTPLGALGQLAGLGVLSLALSTGLWVEPKVKRLHLELYGVRSTPQQRVEAGKSVRLWRGMLQLANVLGVLGLWVYTWEVSNPGVTARFLSPAKLRG